MEHSITFHEAVKAQLVEAHVDVQAVKLVADSLATRANAASVVNAKPTRWRHSSPKGGDKARVATSGSMKSELVFATEGKGLEEAQVSRLVSLNQDLLLLESAHDCVLSPTAAPIGSQLISGLSKLFPFTRKGKGKGKGATKPRKPNH